MQRQPKDSYTIFVNLPSSETVSVRNLSKTVTVAELRDRLELRAGLPCQLYWIAIPGEKVLEDGEKITFGNGLRNGSVLRTGLYKQWESLYHAVESNRCDADTVYNLLVGHEVNSVDCPQRNPKDTEEGSNSERSLVILYVASFFGYVQLCKTVLLLDPEAQFRTTCFGRTALHIAAASDQVNVVNLLLTKHAELSHRDSLGKTPIHYANDFRAYTCERVLRFTLLRGKTNKPRALKHGMARPTTNLCVSRPDTNTASDLTNDPSGPSSRPGPQADLHKGKWESLNDLSKVADNYTPKPPRQSDPKSKVLMTILSTNQDSSGTFHKDCQKQPVFVTVNRVPPEAQKLVTVEFTPLVRPTAQGNKHNRCKSALNRKVGKFAWAEKSLVENDGAIKNREENPRRVQSAQYYRTKYHQSEKETEHRPRPATGGSRFRPWKTWLFEKMEQESAQDETHPERRRRNAIAYRRWLARKRCTAAMQASSAESDSSSEDEGLWDNVRPSPTEQAFSKWLESKRTATIEMIHKKHETEKKAREAEDITKNDIYDRRLTCFEIGCTDPSVIRRPAADTYIASYKNWLKRKKRYEKWKSNHYTAQLPESSDKDLTVDDIEESKYTLFMDGMSYEEWLGLKHRETNLQSQRR